MASGGCLSASTGVRVPTFAWESTSQSRVHSAPNAPDVRAVETWLASLDADAAHQRWQEGNGEAPTTEIPFPGDWVVALTAYPIAPDKRGVGRRLIARGPMKSGQLAHMEQMRKILSDKGSRYDQLDRPFVLALLAWPITAGEFEMTNSLFGSVAVNVSVGHDDHRFSELTRNADGYWRPAPDVSHLPRSATLRYSVADPLRVLAPRPIRVSFV